LTEEGWRIIPRPNPCRSQTPRPERTPLARLPERGVQERHTAHGFACRFPPPGIAPPVLWRIFFARAIAPRKAIGPQYHPGDLAQTVDETAGDNIGVLHAALVEEHSRILHAADSFCQLIDRGCQARPAKPAPRIRSLPRTAMRHLLCKPLDDATNPRSILDALGAVLHHPDPHTALTGRIQSTRAQLGYAKRNHGFVQRHLTAHISAFQSCKRSG
jgi:hypothetical protein